MAAFLNLASVLMCPHGGTVQAVSSNSRVSAAGSMLVRSSDTFVVAGCPFVIGVIASSVHSSAMDRAGRTQRGGRQSTLTESSVGLCVAADQAVQGAVLIVATQPRATGIQESIK